MLRKTYAEERRPPHMTERLREGEHGALSERLALTPLTLGGQKSKLQFWYQN